MASLGSSIKTIVALFALWAWRSVAQVTPYPSATSSAPAQTHTISVGIDHKFKPDITQAEVGDIISFQFFPPNHSVVRAEYEFPCIPYEMTGRGKTGFFSGFRPVDAILNAVI
jgi:plastocyanin